MHLKIDTIADAYSQMRISGLTVNPTPEDLEVALSRLEDMMAEIFVRNIDVGYNFEDEPDPNSLTNTPRYARQMMATNLAVRLVPDFNKTVPEVLIRKASASMSTVSGVSARKFLEETPYPRRQARGSGNTLRYNRWQRFYRNPPSAPSKSSTNFLNAGEVNDYTESYFSYLNQDELISSYSISSDPDLTISDDSNTDEDISYRVTVSSNPDSTTTGFQSVYIDMETSDGRKESRQINFQIKV